MSIDNIGKSGPANNITDGQNTFTAKPMYVQDNYELVFMLHHNATGWTKTSDNKLVHFAVRAYSGQVSMRKNIVHVIRKWLCLDGVQQIWYNNHYDFANNLET